MVLPPGCTMCVGSGVMCREKRGTLRSGGNSMDMLENKIHLLSKCVERRFAEKLFYEGVLHFGYPSEWIKKAEEGNVGQGDLLEGVYTNENKFWNFFR